MNYLKYQKEQKKPIKGTKYRKQKLFFGSYGLQLCENGEVTFNQLTALKKRLNMIFQKVKYWTYLPAKSPKTTKSLGARMGSGKGLVFSYIYKIKKGSIILEWNGLPLNKQQLDVFSILPLKVVVIKKSL